MARLEVRRAEEEPPAEGVVVEAQPAGRRAEEAVAGQPEGRPEEEEVVAETRPDRYTTHHLPLRQNYNWSPKNPYNRR